MRHILVIPVLKRCRAFTSLYFDYCLSNLHWSWSPAGSDWSCHPKTQICMYRRLYCCANVFLQESSWQLITPQISRNHFQFLKNIRIKYVARIYRAWSRSQLIVGQTVGNIRHHNDSIAAVWLIARKASSRACMWKEQCWHRKVDAYLHRCLLSIWKEHYWASLVYTSLFTRSDTYLQRDAAATCCSPRALGHV